MENVEKDVISLVSKKRESFFGLYIPFPSGYRSKKHNLLISTFKHNTTYSKKEIDELLKTYPNDLFNFDYLEQYWVFGTESKKIFLSV